MNVKEQCKRTFFSVGIGCDRALLRLLVPARIRYMEFSYMYLLGLNSGNISILNKTVFMRILV